MQASGIKGKDFLFLLALVGMMIPQQVTMLPNFVAMKYFPLMGGNNIIEGQGGTGLITNTYAGMIAPYDAGAFGVFLFRQFFMNLQNLWMMQPKLMVYPDSEHLFAYIFLSARLYLLNIDCV